MPTANATIGGATIARNRTFERLKGESNETGIYRLGAAGAAGGAFRLRPGDGSSSERHPGELVMDDIELSEAVERAAWHAYETTIGELSPRPGVYAVARAAIAADRAERPVVLPPGWVAVPVEMTEKIVEAFEQAHWSDSHRAVWESLLAALPPRPGQYAAEAQPIKGAPRDGTSFIGLDSLGYPHIVWGDERGFFSISGGDRLDDLEWWSPVPQMANVKK